MRFLAFIFSFIIASAAFCQQSERSEKVNVFIGAGYPEMFHGGIRLNHKQWHFDASSGTTFQKKEFAVSGNVAYHFGSTKLGEGSIQKPWYTSLGMSYTQWTEMLVQGGSGITVTNPDGSVVDPFGTQQDTEEIQTIGKRAYINGRFGRDFRVNSWFNLSLSFGLGVIIHENEDYFYGGPGMFEGLSIPVVPSGQLSFQFKLFNKKN